MKFWVCKVCKHSIEDKGYKALFIPCPECDSQMDITGKLYKKNCLNCSQDFESNWEHDYCERCGKIVEERDSYDWKNFDKYPPGKGERYIFWVMFNLPKMRLEDGWIEVLYYNSVGEIVPPTGREWILEKCKITHYVEYPYPPNAS